MTFLIICLIALIVVLVLVVLKLNESVTMLKVVHYMLKEKIPFVFDENIQEVKFKADQKAMADLSQMELNAERNLAEFRKNLWGANIPSITTYHSKKHFCIPELNYDQIMDTLPVIGMRIFFKERSCVYFYYNSENKWMEYNEENKKYYDEVCDPEEELFLLNGERVK